MEPGVYQDPRMQGFLLDQVQRLTAVLREYQKRYIPINEALVDVEPLAPWMTDPSILSPLITEYDVNIRSLKDQALGYKKELDELKDRTRSIINENNNLHQELRRVIESQLQSEVQSGHVSDASERHIDDLRHKLTLINEEKTHLATMYDKAEDELERLRTDVKKLNTEHLVASANIAQLQDDLQKARFYAEGLQATNQRLKAEHEQFLQAAQSHDREVDDARADLRRATTEAKTLKTLNAELQDHNQKLRDQLRFTEKPALKENILPEKLAEGTIRKLQNEIVELDTRVVSYSKEISKLRNEKAELEEQLSALQRRNMAIEENEYQAILRVRDSVQLVENALLEREQALVREQQKAQEAARLQEAISNLLKQADAKKKEEISSVKEQHRKQMQELIEDLHQYETDNAEKQTLIERLGREKLAAEKQLEKLYQEGPAEANRAGVTLEGMQRRLATVELSKDEALLALDNVQAVARRSQAKHESEKVVLTAQLEECRKQLKTVQHDLHVASESRLQLQNETDKLRKELVGCKELMEEANLRSSVEIASLKQKLELLEQESGSRLRSSEDTSKQAVNDLREMLSAQQRINSKWRDESRTLCEKFETTISRLKQDIATLKQRNNELEEQLAHETEKRVELEQETSNLHVSLDRGERLLSDAESKAEAAAAQVQTLLNREKQLLQDRKLLNREVDQMRLELSRNSRHQTSGQQWNRYIDENQLGRLKL